MSEPSPGPPSLAPPLAGSVSTSELPPPTYTPSHPQILVTPLPDSPSFFWGRSVQGEVFVKGLGETRGARSGVRQLYIQLSLTNHLPDHQSVSICDFPYQILYPLPPPGQSTSNPSTSSDAAPFPTSHRFNIALPSTSFLPGTLNLSQSNKGEVRWTIDVNLTLSSGSTITERVYVEGTPQEIDLSFQVSDTGGTDGAELPQEEEAVLEKEGVRCRLLVDTVRPRLGSLVRLGVEVRPMERQKTPVAGLSTQPNPAKTLRPLRRVRVELFRKVLVNQSRSTTSTSNQASSSSSGPIDQQARHLSLLYTSGKSLRYPGSSSTHPPLRVLFTIPTTQLGSVADQTWGEITQATPYHDVSFFVRVTIGFGSVGETSSATTPEPSSSSTPSIPWTLEKMVEIRPKVWREPRHVVIQRGEQPALGQGATLDVMGVSSEGMAGEDASDGLSDEETAREAYRLKGLDRVGHSGTFRLDSTSQDLPPPFDQDVAGPSGSAAQDTGEGGSGLPSFLESELQMRFGEAPLPSEMVPSERLVPVGFQQEDEQDGLNVGRRGSLGGELGTWIEYDGYETFSVAPPDVAASYGVGSVMDPPQDGDDEHNVVGGMMGRLGFEGGHVRGTTGHQLIEQLGLGEGSRVVDLQDDLPPGIDEPSLPALPGFGVPRHQSHPSMPPEFTSPGTDSPGAPVSREQPPPSFAASEAAVAGQRRVSQSTARPVVGLSTLPRVTGHAANVGPVLTPQEPEGDAPPGYFGAGGQGGGGPPAYS